MNVKVKARARTIMLELGQSNNICNLIYIANIPGFKRVQFMGLVQPIVKFGFWIGREVRNTIKMHSARFEVKVTAR